MCVPGGENAYLLCCAWAHSSISPTAGTFGAAMQSGRPVVCHTPGSGDVSALPDSNDPPQPLVSFAANVKRACTPAKHHTACRVCAVPIGLLHWRAPSAESAQWPRAVGLRCRLALVASRCRPPLLACSVALPRSESLLPPSTDARVDQSGSGVGKPPWPSSLPAAGSAYWHRTAGGYKWLHPTSDISNMLRQASS